MGHGSITPGEASFGLWGGAGSFSDLKESNRILLLWKKAKREKEN
jgi:hypothetical protein